jgi:peptidoglycan/LPS O-acetylase OafA/YrhL
VGGEVRDAQGPELTYQPALDGLRAVAVLVVLLYHGGVAWAGGGFLGVEVFFVLSGFLITSLLLAEDQAGGLRLAEFWLRRARRLLPALLALVVVCCLYELVAGPTRAVPDFGADALSSLFYVANWHALRTNNGYFAQGALVSPLQHTWSLAIEEQFYFCWPPVLMGALYLGRRWSNHSPSARYRPLVVVSLAGWLGSSIEMALLYGHGAGLNRVYYGTDTRAGGLMAGCLLASLVASRKSAQGEASGSGGFLPSRLVGPAGLLGAGGLVALFALERESSAFLFKGGLFLLDLSVVLVILGVTGPQSRAPVRLLLSLKALRGIGLISYGLYLWHFPLMLWLTENSTGLSGLSLLWLRLGASLAAAVLSFFLVEQPVRKRALRGRMLGYLGPLAGSLAIGLSVACSSVLVGPAGAATSTKPRAPQDCGHQLGGNKGTSRRCPPVRVLVIGDSIGLTVGIEVGFDAKAYGVIEQDRAELGCGFVVGYDVAAPVMGWTRQSPRCAEALAGWRKDERRFNPDVVVVEMGYWDLADHMRNGHVTHIGEPGFDAVLARRVRHLVSLLGSAHRPVVLLGVPPVEPPPLPNGAEPPEASASRRQEINSILRSVARAEPAFVHYFDLAPTIAPGGRFQADVDGGVCRSSDGVHLYDGSPPDLLQTRCGARLEKRLLPYLRRVSRPLGVRVRRSTRP